MLVQMLKQINKYMTEDEKGEIKSFSQSVPSNVINGGFAMAVDQCGRLMTIDNRK